MAVASNNRLLATVAYQLDGKRTYALEGAIFIVGAGVQWLRDGLKIVKNAAETGALARAADKNQNVYLVPAFVGLGAPYWNADARGVSRRVASGLLPEPEVFAKTGKREKRFTPKMDARMRAKKLAGWNEVVRKLLG